MLIRSGEGFNHLGSRIPGYGVAAHDIVAGSIEKQNPIGIPAYVTLLNDVVFAAALKTDTKINIPVWIVDAAIPVIGAAAKSIPIAVDEAKSATSGAIGTDRIVGPDIPLEPAIGDKNYLKTAPAIVGASNVG